MAPCAVTDRYLASGRQAAAIEHLLGVARWKLAEANGRPMRLSALRKSSLSNSLFHLANWKYRSIR
jgi:hypothetical protein